MEKGTRSPNSAHNVARAARIAANRFFGSQVLANPSPHPAADCRPEGQPRAERRSGRASRVALFERIRASIPFTISDLAPPGREILGGASYPQSRGRGTLRYIYYKHLDKRITALEEAWAWATPRTFGWVDSKGNIEIVSENRAARRLRERAERLDPQLKLDFDPQPASSEATPAPAVQPWLPGLDPVSCAEAAEFTAEFAVSANARVCPPDFRAPRTNAAKSGHRRGSRFRRKPPKINGLCPIGASPKRPKSRIFQESGHSRTFPDGHAEAKGNRGES